MSARRMKFSWITAIFALFVSAACVSPVMGDAVLRGYVERGGCKVLSSVTGTQVKAQCSYPGATVTVYDTGTTNLATLTSATDCTTPKSNPLTANSAGYYEFCTAVGTYDLRFSGSNISAPWTYTFVVADPTPQVLPVTDTTAIVKGSSDTSKLMRFEVDGLSTATTRVITVPNANTTLPVFSQPVTFTGPSAARTVTMPDANITLINAGQPFVFTGTSASRTITWPDSATSIPAVSQTLTFTGPSAARTITLPDANFTVARTDAANTFTGNQNVTGNLLFSPDATYTIGAAGATRPSNIFASGSIAAATSFLGTILDSNAASDLVLRYNGSARLTFGASTNNTMVGNLLFSPKNTYAVGSSTLYPSAVHTPQLRLMHIPDTSGAYTTLYSGSFGGMYLLNSLSAASFIQIVANSSASSNDYIRIQVDPASAGALIGVGSGSLQIGTDGTSSGDVQFFQNGNTILHMYGTDLYPHATLDLGRTAPFRDLYLSGMATATYFTRASGFPTLADGTDTTKRLAFDLTGITTGNMRVATPPNSSFTMARTDAAQTFTGLQTFGSFAVADPTNAGLGTIGQNSELITLSTVGTTSDSSANLLPANALILGVGCRITTTITTSANWSVGDTTTAARFSSANATLAAGTTSVGLNHWKGAVTTDATGPTQAAAAKLRITTNAAAGAGAVRCTVHYVSFTAPTS